MTVEQRLEKLERQNKWMRRIASVAVALVAAVFLMAQGKEKELPDLEVRKLTVKGKDGRTTNVVGGIMTPSFVAYLAAAPNLTRLKLSQNRLSCDLGDGWSGVAEHVSIRHGVLDVLVGNLFGCPVPSALRDEDKWGASYVCGVRALAIPLAL